MADMKWIPVTERLPECDGRYLCNVKSFSFPGTFYRTILQYEDGGLVFEADGVQSRQYTKREGLT